MAILAKAGNAFVGKGRRIYVKPVKREKPKDWVPEIKNQISIPIVAEKFFPGWTPKKSCKSPFRNDQKPSFSVYDNGTKWNDYATGEHGSVIDFYMLCRDCGKAQAIADLKGWLNGDTGDAAPIIRAQGAQQPEEPKQQTHPDLRIPTDEELAVISELRKIRDPALQIAVERGFLWTAASQLYGCECLIITDQTRKTYRARRLDGKPIKPGVKAVCVTGSQASWPIGLEEAKDFPCIALCEGEMDFLAAFDHALSCGTKDQVAPVCMSGASNWIPDEVIPLFEGKRVRIFIHADRAGEDAWNRWRVQLRGTATEITGFDFSGRTMEPDESVVTDLNDLLRISPDCLQRNREEVTNIMKF
jgi:hypothetical protein